MKLINERVMRLIAMEFSNSLIFLSSVSDRNKSIDYFYKIGFIHIFCFLLSILSVRPNGQSFEFSSILPGFGEICQILDLTNPTSIFELNSTAVVCSSFFILFSTKSDHSFRLNLSICFLLSFTFISSMVFNQINNVLVLSAIGFFSKFSIMINFSLFETVFFGECISLASYHLQVSLLL